MITLEQYREAFTPLYRKFSTHYQKLFYSGLNEDRAHHLLGWLDALVGAQIPLEQLEPYACFIIEKSNRYAKYPPTPSQFTKDFDDWRRWSSAQASEQIPKCFREKFDEFYLNMGLRYGQWWAKGDTNAPENHYNFWLHELFGAKIQAEHLTGAYQRVRSMAQYRLYPPNIDQFLDLAAIASIDASIPSVEESYALAIASRSSAGMHPLIAHVRAKFGYQSLIGPAAAPLKRQFEQLYSQALTQLLDGKMSLEAVHRGLPEAADPAEHSAEAEAEAVISALDSILLELGRPRARI